MSKYTDSLPAEGLIRHIARSYVELSHDKVLAQRNDFIKICDSWLKANLPPAPPTPPPEPMDNNF